ncbi:MAG: HAD family hydrolase [Chloroflexi bacterium]|nr:HAD family hydrolase [Chloroflexota bacterium]
MMDIDAVLFDVDGTLINSDDVDADHWERRITRFYRDEEDAERAARRIVMAKETPGNAVFTLMDSVGLDSLAVRLALRLQGSGDIAATPAVPGAVDAVARVAAHLPIATVTTRSEAEQAAVLGALGLKQYFSAFVGRDTVWRLKPHPLPVQAAASRLGVDPARCLMIGDTTVDVRAGQRAGAKTIAVLSGYGTRRELERVGPDLILDSIAQLPEVLFG